MRLVLLLAGGALVVTLAIVLFFGPPLRSNWTFTSTTDPMNDVRTSQARIASANGEGHLALECQNGVETKVFFLTSRRLVGFSPDEQVLPQTIAYRIDGGPKRYGEGAILDNFAGFSGEGSQYAGRPVMEALPEADRLAVEFHDHRLERIVMDFDLAGAGAALDRLAGECRPG